MRRSLLNSGIAQHALDFVWQGTAEGDFAVLSREHGRYLLRQTDAAERGEPLASFTKVLLALRDPAFDPTAVVKHPATADEVVDHANLESALESRVLLGAKHVSARFKAFQRSSPKASREAALNAVALDLEALSLWHTAYFMFHNFREYVAAYSADADAKRALARLCSLYGLSELKGSGWVGILSGRTPPLIEQALARLLEELRPDVAALADAMDVPDAVLNSTLGRSDGKVYEALLDAARKAPLNRHRPFLGYADVLQPHLDKEFLALRGRADESLKEAAKEWSTAFPPAAAAAAGPGAKL